jgi:hypothetical protein
MFIKQAQKFLLNYIYNNYKNINVKSGNCRYNYKCQMNAVHEAITHNQDYIAVVFYIDNNEPILHFINVNKYDEFFDNTLGVWSSKYDYYLIDYIYKSEFFEVNDYFIDLRIKFNKMLPFYLRYFVKNEII